MEERRVGDKLARAKEVERRAGDQPGRAKEGERRTSEGLRWMTLERGKKVG